MRKKPSRAIGYCRVSTHEQADKGLSLKNQAEKIRQYCKLKDIELVETIEDAGESAKNLDRPGMQQIIKGCSGGEFDIVVIYKLDRLTRKVRDLGYLIEDIFERNGVQFASLKESFDTSTANGKLFMNILGVVAQWERDIISERTRDVLQSKKSKGERLGPPFYGLRLDESTGELSKHPEEMKVLNRARELRGLGLTLHEIAQVLNRENYRTRQRSLWKHQNISYLLKSDVDFASLTHV